MTLSRSGLAFALERSTLAFAALVCLADLPALRAQGTKGTTRPPFAGRELAAVLADLAAAGLPVVFTSETVHPGMRIGSEPISQDPRTALEQALQPLGLRLTEPSPGVLVIVSDHSGSKRSVGGRVLDRLTRRPVPDAKIRVEHDERSWTTDAQGRFRITDIRPGTYTLSIAARGYQASSLRDVRVEPGRDSENLELLMTQVPVLAQQIEIHGSASLPPPEVIATTTVLDRDAQERLPAFGDPLRGFTSAPGTISGDVTAQVAVRGGRSDEIRMVLDGQELYEAFHLQDFESAISIIPSAVLQQTSLTRGGMSATHGDRLGGAIDLETGSGSVPHGRLTLSFLEASMQGSGLLPHDRGGWVLSLRRGLLDIGANQQEREEDPLFWDAFGKIEFWATSRQALRLHVLAASDKVRYVDQEADTTDTLDTSYDNWYSWASHDAVLRTTLFVQTMASVAAIDRDRNGSQTDEENEFAVRDVRDSDVRRLSQAWRWQPRVDHMIRAGWEVNKFTSTFDYESVSTPDHPLQNPAEDEVVRDVDEEISGDHLGLWITDRWTLDNLTAEVGARYDRHSPPEERFVSPRAGIAYQVGKQSRVHLSWGRFMQSQRPYELQVEDGESELYPAEDSRQWTLGGTRTLDTSSFLQSIGVDLYRWDISNPRPRYENILDPANRFPEAEPDRVRIVAERSYAHGAELTARFRMGTTIEGTFAYTWQQARDRVDDEDVPRLNDQTHAVILEAAWHFGPAWLLDAVVNYHTGWPTTPVDSQEIEDPEDGETEYTLVAGPLNSERLPDYHRIDLRLSYTRPVHQGSVTGFVEVRNVFNRLNTIGTDVSLDDETGEIEIGPEDSSGIVPVVGIRWDF